MDENKPKLTRENVTELLDKKFLRLFDLSFFPGRHYYVATRRRAEELVALKSEKAFRSMLPDAVGCVVVLKCEGREPLLILVKELRYPTGQFLLGVPAGLLDKEDLEKDQPIFSAALRELKEETGLTLEETDEIKLINPLLFSSPGMTDESNAMVQITLKRDEMPVITQAGAVGGECIGSFVLLTREDAKQLLQTGVDADGIFYSVYTWIALMTFVSGLWE